MSRRKRFTSGQIIRGIEEAKILSAKALIRQIRAAGIVRRLADVEFKVFSQFGDDGIIQYLIHQIDLPPTFVEFGVEDYTEANTRFLLVNDNWRGLVMDASRDHVKSIKGDDLSWRHDLTAVSAFIDRDNINGLLLDNGFAGEIGLLSIDVDGNDYWVWERIDAVEPTIVIAEYNSVFGVKHAVSIPYDPSFVRTKAHYSNLYWGCSLKALCVLAERKDFAFVGCNSSGNNAYFVRQAVLGDLQPLSVEQGYVESRFRESRDPNGKLTFLAGPARRETIGEMPVENVETGEMLRICELD